MNKICTTIEQSKKLIELGLDVNTADMYYQYVLPKSGKIMHNPKIGNPINALEWYNKGYTTSGKEPITLNEYCVPCWSLAALLGVLPEKYTELIKEGGMYRIIIKDSYMTCLFGNPIDACYEMILKLHERNLL